MSVGITSIGAYVPYYRMKRETIAAAWQRGALKGERSIANNDEDSLTMAVEAVINCFNGLEREKIDALFLASTTAPYDEKSSSGLIATVCDLKDQVVTADFGNCLKAGTTALRAAADMAKAQSAEQVVVVAADCRAAYPKSDQEQLFADAAAALTIGTENVIAEIEFCSTVNTEIIDVWRIHGEKYVQNAEARFALDQGYTSAMKRVINDMLKKAGLKAQDISKVVLSSPGLKDNMNLAKKLGFAESQIQDALMMQVGNCGTAQPLLMLIAALEDAKPGDRILLAAYGNGADAFIFRVTENIARMTAANGVKKYLTTKRVFESYNRYLSFRGLLEANPGEPFRLFPSNAAYWRDQKSILRFYGSKCKNCGTSIYPINRICNTCGSKDTFEEIRLSDRKGKVFTFSIDRLAGRSDDPVVVQTVAEDDAGVRYYLLMTEFDQQEVKVGMDVEFTFRKIYEGANYINYFWKCRPVRMGGLCHDNEG
ncbi:MAG: 3-oxoacyl-[acyl-carrier-protein] synthase III C-terminal domain-containing protein [Negativicutes bacterium]|nr:3-oxoacyl-[acyl-carrier-protein] synthase III C-terminal domain-containing protein [Negativicutes bacterium]